MATSPQCKKIRCGHTKKIEDRLRAHWRQRRAHTTSLLFCGPKTLALRAITPLFTPMGKKTKFFTNRLQLVTVGNVLGLKVAFI